MKYLIRLKNGFYHSHKEHSKRDGYPLDCLVIETLPEFPKTTKTVDEKEVDVVYLASWNGSEWVYKDKDEYGAEIEAQRVEMEANVSIYVPTSITPRQARIILLQNGLLDDVEEAVKTNREFEIYWEYSLEVNRNDAVLIQMAEALGISSEMLDSMFIEGSKL